MKKMFGKLLPLALCAAMVCALPAFAAEAGPTRAPAGVPAPVRVWGALTRLENGSLFLQNSNPNDPNREIVVHLGEETIVVDAVTGDPMDPDSIRDGDTVYAWVGPAMTMSLPPQSTAQVVVGNIPADFGAPQYYEVAAADSFVTLGIPGRDGVKLTATSGEEITVMDDARIVPYLTRQMVSLRDLVPGARMLVWTSPAGTVTRVMVFAYGYRGYAALDAYGNLTVSGLLLPEQPRTPYEDGRVYLPLRAVAEAAGYTVAWDQTRGAVVTDSGTEVFAVCPDTSLAHTPDGDRGLSGPCLIAGGVTYLPAGDLAMLLNLFYAG